MKTAKYLFVVLLLASVNVLAEEDPSPKISGAYIVRGGAYRSMRYETHLPVVPDSALDMTRGVIKPVDQIVIREGQLYRQSAPDTPIRFYSSAFLWEYRHSAIGETTAQTPFGSSRKDRRKEICDYAQELYKRGFNLIRINSPWIARNGLVQFDDRILSHRINLVVRAAEKADKGYDKIQWYDPSEVDWEKNRIKLDEFDCFLAECRKRGIYIHVTLDNNFVRSFRWHPQFKDEVSNGIKLHYDKTARNDWILAAKAFLEHVNPYTGRKMKNDPQVLFCIGFNEQDFALSRKKDWAPLEDEWRKFVNDPESPCPTFDEWKQKGERYEKIEKFLFKKDAEMAHFFHSELRKLGYEGFFTNYDVLKTLRYVELRHEGDFDVMHCYHDHPTNRLRNTPQRSVFSKGNSYFLGAIGSKNNGRVLFVNEFDMCYPLKYRYQNAFVFSAYAAFHRVCGLAPWSNSVITYPRPWLMPFCHGSDPVAIATDVQNYLLFMRGDIKPTDETVTLTYNSQALFKQKLQNSYIDLNQLRMAFVTGFQTDSTGAAKGISMPLVAGGRAVDVNIGEGGKVADGGGTSVIVYDDKGTFDPNRFLREKKLIGDDNRTNIPHEYESNTKELYLNTDKKYMTINAPRFQGFCSDSPRAVKTRDLDMEIIKTPGVLSFSTVAVDTTLDKADRILIIYATNALSNRMQFKDKTMREVLKHGWGTTPVLIQYGEIGFSLRNANAKKMKLYTLDFTGERREEIPVSINDKGELAGTINTKKLSMPTVFFELVAE